MFSHQARINTRTLWKDRLTPTTAAAIQLACDLALFALLCGAALVLARGYLTLASGDLQTVLDQAEATRGW
jgi:hypothetical protein